MTTSASDPGLRPERVAQIVVRLPGDGPGRRGSGYLVAPGKVLTAAHVVHGAADVRVLFEADRPGRRLAAAEVRWTHPGIDVAVLELQDEAGGHGSDTDRPGIETDRHGPPMVTYGRLGEQDAVVRCTALGFPRFKLRTTPDGSRFRDAEHVQAACAVLSNRREGTLDLAVMAAPPEDPDPRRDAWEGMSGAAVFSGGRLVGVVTRHHRGDGPGRIAASRVDRWADALDATEQAALEELLGQELRFTALPSVAPPSTLHLLQEAYRAQLADIAPERLEERQPHLADLVSFCAGQDSYLWLQGPPWAGKTALASWFALHPPRGVVPVWFFITARQAGQSDSDAYTAAVVDQLAAIVGREPLTPGSPAARDGERRLLLRQAAEQLAQQDRTLLLIVDGLDEDQSLTLGSAGTSIAALLPERPPPNVRVLVTSRTSPGLPADVKGDHPLRDCRVTRLEATQASRHTQYEATHDLHKALSGDRLQRDLVGLLTAARGTLTTDDLRELTGEPAFELNRRLSSAFGRILRLRGRVSGGGGSGPEGYGDDLALYTSARGYLLAHESLLSTAQQDLGPDLDIYLDRLHAWATSYEEGGWPERTPVYLLQPYGRLLAFLRDSGRLAALAVDARRHDLLRGATGSDAACLAEMGAAREILTHDAPGDLEGLAALAAAEDLVAQRNASLHPDIPAVYARLGRVRHAIGLAHSVLRPLDRARALSGVARELAETGDRRAVGLAREAVRLAEAGPEADIGSPSWQVVAARGVLAQALALRGLEGEAVQALAPLNPPRDEGRRHLVDALAGTAVLLADPTPAAGMLRRARQVAESIHFLPHRVRALVTVAEAWSTAGAREEADEIYDAVTGLARRGTVRHGNLPAAVAQALHEPSPGRAAAMVELVQAALGEEPPVPSPDSVPGVVCGLVVANRLAEAQQLLDTAGTRRRLAAPASERSEMWRSLALGWARAGRPRETANALLNLAQQWPDPSEPGLVEQAVRLLADAGAVDGLDALLFAAADRANWTLAAEGLVALAARRAPGAPDEALRLLHEAEHGAPSSATRDSYERDVRLGVLAGALARAGRADDAERLAEALREPMSRSWASSAVALAVAQQDLPRSRRLAERAYELVTTPGLALRLGSVETAAVEALARSGSTERLDEAFGDLPGLRALSLMERGSVPASVIEALWERDPARAEGLADHRLYRLLPRPLLDIAEFFLAVDRHDAERGVLVRQVLLNRTANAGPVERLTPHEQALAVLMAAVDDPLEARRLLDGMPLSWIPLPQGRPALALVHAALGDHEAALDAALRITDARLRAEACAQLAAYTACAADGMTARSFFGGTPATLLTLRRLAARLLPPPGGPDLPRARALLAAALTPAGWDTAVRVLAEIDPAAVRKVRDVVFAHLDLD
ncbi:trypsin-like peptidase domain-containing protein [Streptomyces sp. NPDC096205]|uniref:trypsin-like peptidase domain-containing protein n=1 Tax=Streptomyces sp. NPDC096205 TaxID=3366081 RepID=UPI0037FCFE1E